jgi:septal ring factor EnvC (AmiA/AmiB activator)
VELELRALFRLFLCAVFLVGTSPVRAEDLKDILAQQQKQIELLRQQLELIHGELQTVERANSQLGAQLSEVRAENNLMKDMLKNVIATQATDRAHRPLQRSTRIRQG